MDTTTTKTKLMQMYQQSKSDKPNKSLSPKQKCQPLTTKKKNTHVQMHPNNDRSEELNEYLSIATQQRHVRILQLPLRLLEVILYDYFFPFQRYGYVRVCKLFKFLIDDTLQCTLNNSVNDHRLHNFELNAYYFYNHNFSDFVVPIASNNNTKSIVMDLSNETLRIFSTEQKRFLSYFFMFQSKFALLYSKQILSNKYKKYKKRHERKRKHGSQNNTKSHWQILCSFVSIVCECNKVLCGGNAIWFHVSGMDIFGPVLQSKYCTITSLSLDRNYINDEMLLLFCKAILFRNVLYGLQSQWRDLTFLRRIDLSHNGRISDIGLNTLFAVIGEKCPNLEEIYLSNLASITNLTCKIIYKFYKLFGEKTKLKMIVLNRNKWIDEKGIDVLNSLFTHNVISRRDTNVRFFVSQCGVNNPQLLYNNGWDTRIKLRNK